MIRRVWTDAAVALLRELYPNTRTRDLVGILDASERQIYSKASTLGLTKSAEYLASEDSGRELLTLARGQLSLRIATDQNSRLELCEGPDYTWKRSHTNLGCRNGPCGFLGVIRR